MCEQNLGLEECLRFVARPQQVSGKITDRSVLVLPLRTQSVPQTKAERQTTWCRHERQALLQSQILFTHLITPCRFSSSHRSLHHQRIGESEYPILRLRPSLMNMDDKKHVLGMNWSELAGKVIRTDDGSLKATIITFVTIELKCLLLYFNKHYILKCELYKKVLLDFF